MYRSHSEQRSSVNSGRGTPANASPQTELNPTAGSKTMGEISTEVQELRRENFSLKLRIFFLEEQTELHGVSSTPPTPTQRRRLPSQPDYPTHELGPHNSHSGPPLSFNRHTLVSKPNDDSAGVHSDEIIRLRTSLQRCEKENAELRRELGRTIDASRVEVISSHEASGAHFEDREHQLRSEIAALRRALSNLQQEHTRSQAQVKQCEDEKRKADRTLRRLKEDYDQHIARSNRPRSHSTSSYDSCQHEQSQASSPVSVDEHARKISELQRIIEQLRAELRKQSQQQSPSNPTSPSDSPTTTELRQECERYRRLAIHLQKRLDELNALIDPRGTKDDSPKSATSGSHASGRQSPKDPNSPTSNVNISLHSAVDNLAALTSRIARLMRENAEYQKQLRIKDEQLQEYRRREGGTQRPGSQTDGDAHRSQGSRTPPDLSQYASQIQEAKARIQQLEQQLREANERHNACEEALERQRQAQGHGTGVTVHADLKELTDSIREKEEQIGTYHKRLAELNDTVRSQEERFERWKADDRERERDERSADKKQLSELQTSYTQLQTFVGEQSAQYDNQIQNYQNRLTAARNEYETSLAELRRTNESVTNQLKVHERNGEQQRAAFEALQESYHRAQRDRDEQASQAVHWKREFERVNSDLAAAEKQLNQMRQEMEAQRRSLNQLQGNLARCEAEKEENVRHYNEQLTLRDQEIQKLEKESKKKNNNNGRLIPIEIVPAGSERRSPTAEDPTRIADLQEEIRQLNEYINRLREAGYIPDELPDPIQFDLRIHIDSSDESSPAHDRPRSDRTRSPPQRGSYQPLSQTPSPTSPIETVQRLQTELRKCQQRTDELQREHSVATEHHSRRVQQLEAEIRDREERLARLSQDLQQATQVIKKQQQQLEQCEESYQHVTIELNIALEEKKNLSDQVQGLEDEVQRMRGDQDRPRSGTTYSRPPSVNANQLDHERAIHSLRVELNDCQQARSQLQSEYSEAQRRYDQMKKQLTSDIEDLNQTAQALRQELARCKEDLHRTNDENATLKRRVNELMPGSNDPSSAIVALRVQIEERDREIERLRRALQATPSPPDGNASAKESPNLHAPKSRPRPNLDRLDRDELRFEIDQLLQENERLTEHCKKQNPPQTELHNQLVQTREELRRQQYVNQVLWRKLDALSAIHGSKTLSELTQELANYEDVIAKLNQQLRTNAVRSDIINTSARSSSEQNLSVSRSHPSIAAGEPPSKNIKSTVALLERSNIEWQAKLARLTEQLGRSESQSRNYQRELSKYQKLLYEAGLVEPSARQRRHSAEDSATGSFNRSPKAADELTETRNADQLKNLVRDQQKLIHQLQMRVRLNIAEDVQSEAVEKLNEQVKNLHSVIDTYQNESDLLKNELTKLYKALESKQRTLQDYEKRFQDQQAAVEQVKRQAQKYQQWIQKHDLGLPLFDDKRERMDSMNDLIIDLDIDIIQGNDKKKTTTPRDPLSPSLDAANLSECQQRLRKREDEIRRLHAEIEMKNARIHQLENQRPGSTSPVDERDRGTQGPPEKPNRVRQKSDSTNIVRIELEHQNQQLRDQNDAMRHELERCQSLITQLKITIETLERETTHINPADEELRIRRGDLSDLLREIQLLRRDLELSISKQKELQIKLDENIRQSQSPRSFKFSGHGVSFPDLRIVEATGVTGTEYASPSIVSREQRARVYSSTAAGLDHAEITQRYERDFHARGPRAWVVGETAAHNELRRIVEDVKFDLKAILPELRDHLRQRGASSADDPVIRSLEENLHAFDERLIHALDLVETYRQTNLPDLDEQGEHRLIEENKNLLVQQKKYLELIRHLKDKYKQHAGYIDQLLAQISKMNRQKNDTGEYLASLLQPTLSVLQRARSNIENHLKETNPDSMPPGSAPSHRSRRRAHQQ